MPSKTDMPSREQIEAEAAQAAARAAELRERLHRHDAEEARRRYEGERAWDEAFVADFSIAALDADVDQAREQLDQTLAESPVVAALVAHAVALNRRRTLTYEARSAAMRLDPTLPDQNQHPLPEAFALPPSDMLATAVDRLVAQQLAADRAEREAARVAAGDAAAGTA